MSGKQTLLLVAILVLAALAYQKAQRDAAAAAAHAEAVGRANQMVGIVKTAVEYIFA